jgi:DNA topoisomerase-3
LVLAEGESIVIVVLAEKPSVARDIANVLGADGKEEGYFVGNGYQVTWAFGHLVKFVEPEGMKLSWGKPWRKEVLPMVPAQWDTEVMEGGKKQFNVIKKLFSKANDVVCAMDAGREGENIFRLIYEKTGCRAPVKRLWISSLTKEAIEDGFDNLKRGPEFDNLASAAMARSRADWLVGLNCTRAYTLRNGSLCTVGRVQTATLALIVNRENEIRNFKSSNFYELLAHARDGFRAKWLSAQNETRIDQKTEAEKLFDKVRNERQGIVKNVEVETKRQKAPPLFNLLLLQKEANKQFGYTAAETLKLAQDLYEKEKIITYPRTESTVISRDMVKTLPGILKNVPDQYKLIADEALSRFNGGLKLGKTYVDDTKLTDHHAIIPTNKKAGSLDTKLGNVYRLVVERFLAIFLPERVVEETTVFLDVKQETFRARGSVVLEDGWKKALSKTQASDDSKDKDEEDNQPLPKLSIGNIVAIDKFELAERETKPPKRYNDSSLLTAMKNAGRTIEDDELAAILKENGIGTPATRAEMIEKLIRIEYIKREKKTIFPTGKGIALIAQVADGLKSAETTARWEQKLGLIEDGIQDAQEFEKQIVQFVKETLIMAEKTPAQTWSSSCEDTKSIGKCPLCGGAVVERDKAYGCSKYRETRCGFTIWKVLGEKKITKAQAIALLTKGKTDLIKGFKGKTSGKVFDARLQLDESGNVKYLFDSNSREPLGKCPVCHEGDIIEGNKGYGCSRWREGCKFVIWKTLAEKTITVPQVKALLEKGQTGKLTGFVSKKSGKKFDARLKLNLERGVEFVFDAA